MQVDVTLCCHLQGFVGEQFPKIAFPICIDSGHGDNALPILH